MILVCGRVHSAESDKTYVFGVVPQFEANKLRTIWQPVINYLELETGLRFRIKGSPTIPDFESEFMQGDFDFAYMNPYHIMLANRKKGYIPLVKDAGTTLHGVLVVKKDSGISQISELNGRTVAFPAPNALGASLLMRQEIIDRFHTRINPAYVKTHDSVYLNVLLGEAAAGAGVQKTLDQQRPEYRSALKIIHKTREFSPHPIAAHPGVPEKVRQAVKTALLKLGKTDEGRNILTRIPIMQIGETSMEDYLPLAALGLERFYVQ
jgi:phosphonate transport system substrate-binding protein